MTAELIDEIARRLGLSTEEVAPALDTVTERIRQQVAHYGYARLAHLGTFRSRDGSIVFEPEPDLTERINARFSGLNELVLEPGSSEPESDDPADLGAAPAASGTSDWTGTAGTDDRPLNPWEGTEAPDDPDLYDHQGQSTPGDDDSPLVDSDGFEGESETTETDFDGIGATSDSTETDFDGMHEPDRDRADMEGATDPGRNAPDMEGVTDPGRDAPDMEGFTAGDRPADDTGDTESDAGTHADEERGAFWSDVERPGSEHPLGPESEPPFEEADFSVLGGREDPSATGDEAHQPTVSWEPLGEADRRTHAPAEPEDDPADDIDDVRAEEEPADAPGQDADKTGDAQAASSDRGVTGRSSTPGRMSGDGPVRTIRTPSRRSKSRRDMKPVWFGVGIIVIVAAAALAYFTIPTLSPGPNADAVVQSESMPPSGEGSESGLVDPDEAAGGDPSDELADAPESVPDGDESVGNDGAPTADAAASPLRSDEEIDPDEGGFTIIVYSETDAASAEAVVQEYQDVGFRVGLLTSEQDGVTRYRVGVGQFDTLDEATQQRDDLAGSDLPGDAWILRL